MKKQDLTNVSKIELISFTNTKGFTKEQSQEIINKLIEAFNNPSNEDEIKITVSSLPRFEMYVDNNKSAILQVLDRMHAKIKEAGTNNGQLYDKMKKLSSNKQLQLTKDGFLTDGGIALKVDNINFNFNDDVKKLDNFNLMDVPNTKDGLIIADKSYMRVDNMHFKKGAIKDKNGNIIDDKRKFTFFIKDLSKNDFVVIQSKYYDLIPNKKNVLICFENTADISGFRKVILIDKNTKNIIGVIMPVGYIELEHFNSDDMPSITGFENTQDEIIKLNVNEVKYPIVVYESKATTTTTTKQHTNAITGHIYSGQNAVLLDNAGFTSHEWVGAYQAKKLNKQVKKDAKGVTIKVYIEKDDGRAFCKLETIYNIDELEPIQKVENTDDYRELISRLKRA